MNSRRAFRAPRNRWDRRWFGCERQNRNSATTGAGRYALGDERAVSEKSQDLVPEDELGLVGIDIRDGMPRAVIEEEPARDDGVNVRIPLQRRPEGLDDGDHAGSSLRFAGRCSHHLADGCSSPPGRPATGNGTSSPSTSARGSAWEASRFPARRDIGCRAGCTTGSSMCSSSSRTAWRRWRFPVPRTRKTRLITNSAVRSR